MGKGGIWSNDAALAAMVGAVCLALGLAIGWNTNGPVLPGQLLPSIGGSRQAEVVGNDASAASDFVPRGANHLPADNDASGGAADDAAASQSSVSASMDDNENDITSSNNNNDNDNDNENENSSSEGEAVADEVAPRAVTFINNLGRSMRLHWNRGSRSSEDSEVLQAVMHPGEHVIVHTYDDHVFVFREEPSKVIFSITAILANQTTVYADPKQLTTFHADYEAEHGYPWYNVYPREPMVHDLIYPEYLGEKRLVHLSPAHYTNRSGLASLDSYQPVVMHTVSMSPKIFYMEDFLSPDECDHIIQVTQDKGDLARSGVKTTGEFHSSRTSSNDWIDLDTTDIIENIARRGFRLLNVNYTRESWAQHSEPLQVLRYQLREEYREHYDFHGLTESFEAYIHKGHNRYATLFLYLTDVEEGGETFFPRFNGTYVHNACTNEHGFKVRPKRGAAAIFFSMLPDGNMDRDSLHGSCPVISGEKWAANFWFWDHHR